MAKYAFLNEQPHDFARWRVNRRRIICESQQSFLIFASSLPFVLFLLPPCNACARCACKKQDKFDTIQGFLQVVSWMSICSSRLADKTNGLLTSCCLPSLLYHLLKKGYRTSSYREFSSRTCCSSLRYMLPRSGC